MKTGNDRTILHDPQRPLHEEDEEKAPGKRNEKEYKQHFDITAVQNYRQLINREQENSQNLRRVENSMAKWALDTSQGHDTRNPWLSFKGHFRITKFIMEAGM